MRIKLMAVLMVGALAGPVQAQVTPPPEAPETAVQGIEDVIANQLDALRDRNVDLAFTYASPMIQRLFGGPENFGRMVSQGYPMVWNNASSRFVAQQDLGARILQQVMIQDATGGLHMLEYAMIQVDGAWKTDGVSVLPLPDVGV
ncbi:hypothetical protein AN189_12030 [Loktanella sp. 3ANDIMAR09]|uniref:DUF4864 domain-containing protein n=1 Tax=Loktanella sp. 3ANDIMAR09 TaxID=1225657 RepID=UPI000707A77F|nr:DUF4864 domain-containing protein [Loktanella sp. 3ANDIMAR09]KQI68130.1 hypothetical protein AN189_12030 [Loktanella sp. 3ANDIMAR09]